jgi:NodT family efflux transporter outer membrane factor (OMF) lipoprotein
VSRRLISLCCPLILAACAVGPDFHAPAAPAVSAYVAHSMPATAAQDAAGAYAADARWWTQLGSQAIDDAVQRALTANADLAAAKAALNVAQQQALVQRGAFWPSAALGVSVDRQRTSQSLSPTLDTGQNPYALRTTQVSVAYAPDVFGGARRAQESADSLAEFQGYEVAATQTAVATNVVVAAIRDAALRAQISDAEQGVALQTEVVTLTRRQRDVGAVSNVTVLQQEAVLAQQEAALPPLRKQFTQNQDALIALLGGYPATEAVPVVDLERLSLPTVPLALPSTLVEHRPDIRAAASLLRAASATVGVTKAARLPRLTLTGDFGRANDSGSSLLSSAGRFWDLAGGLTQPIFQGGALLHQQRAAEAALREAQAQYRSTVIGAYQNVADVIQAVDEDRRSVAAAQRLEAAARRTAELAEKQRALGDASKLTTLQAQIAVLSAHANTIDAVSTQYADTVALFHALGFGWSAASATPTGE